MWLICMGLTDLSNIFSQKVIHERCYGRADTLSSSLQRLWKPHGHVVPTYWIKNVPPQPPPPVFSTDAGQIYGHGIFNTEHLSGILYASFSVCMAYVGIMGSLGW